ncbi:MAG: 50S ribosomal protein L25 [Alphaproteobacteria bacterium]|nr:50S ribosomal protein L25 [Alphaproteobacteria bacterium]
MPTAPLQANARDDFGKGAARKLRATGHVPGLIYRAGDPPLHISLDPAELTLIFRRSGNFNTILEISVDGQARQCLLKDTQKHPVSRSLVHVDFVEIRGDEQVVVFVPVRPHGRAKGMEVGGKLQLLRRELKVRCLPADIPAEIPVDIRSIGLGEFRRISDLVPPQGCTFVFDNDFNVVAIAGRRIDAAASDGDEEDEEEAEA